MSSMTAIVWFMGGVACGYGLARLGAWLEERQARKKRLSPTLTIRGTDGWDARWDFTDDGSDR